MFFDRRRHVNAMISNILTRIFGSRNERLLKQYAQAVRQINALEPMRWRRCPTMRCATRPASSKGRVAAGETLDDGAAGGLRGGARGGQARAAHAPLRRAADRRHGAAQRQDRRDAHRRGQDARRHAARVSQCAHRQGRAHRHRQRLPRAARCRLDGPHLPLPRPDRRREPVADGARRRSRPPTRADITYGTNNEFGFDYLRDNMVFAPSERVQRGAATTRSSTRSTRS